MRLSLKSPLELDVGFCLELKTFEPTNSNESSCKPTWKKHLKKISHIKPELGLLVGRIF